MMPCLCGADLRCVRLPGGALRGRAPAYSQRGSAWSSRVRSTLPDANARRAGARRACRRRSSRALCAAPWKTTSPARLPASTPPRFRLCTRLRARCPLPGADIACGGSRSCALTWTRAMRIALLAAAPSVRFSPASAPRPRRCRCSWCSRRARRPCSTRSCFLRWRESTASDSATPNR
eukprot:482373-Rhodomonas_salina.2